MADSIGSFGTQRRQATQADATAPGIEAAIDGQLADAAQVDALAGVDIDHRALAHREVRGSQFGRGGLLQAGGQGQAGAATLRQHALGRVFLVEHRRPAFKGRGGVAATRHG